MSSTLGTLAKGRNDNGRHLGLTPRALSEVQQLRRSCSKSAFESKAARYSTLLFRTSANFRDALQTCFWNSQTFLSILQVTSNTAFFAASKGKLPVLLLPQGSAIERQAGHGRSVSNAKSKANDAGDTHALCIGDSPADGIVSNILDSLVTFRIVASRHYACFIHEYLNATTSL